MRCGSQCLYALSRGFWGILGIRSCETHQRRKRKNDQENKDPQHNIEQETNSSKTKEYFIGSYTRVVCKTISSAIRISTGKTLDNELSFQTFLPKYSRGNLNITTTVHFLAQYHNFYQKDRTLYSEMFRNLVFKKCGRNMTLIN